MLQRKRTYIIDKIYHTFENNIKKNEYEFGNDC